MFPGDAKAFEEGRAARADRAPVCGVVREPVHDDAQLSGAGLALDPVAVVRDQRRDSAAILNGEDGDAGVERFDDGVFGGVLIAPDGEAAQGAPQKLTALRDGRVREELDPAPELPLVDPAAEGDL